MIASRVLTPEASAVAAEARRRRLLREKRGELKRVERHGVDIRVRKIDESGLQVVGKEQRRARAARRHAHERARLRNLVGIRPRPARQPRTHTHTPTV